MVPRLSLQKEIIELLERRRDRLIEEHVLFPIEDYAEQIARIEERLNKHRKMMRKLSANNNRPHPHV